MGSKNFGLMGRGKSNADICTQSVRSAPGNASMRVTSIPRSLLARSLKGIYEWGYRRTISIGSWWEPLLQEASPGLGERILEISAEGCGAIEIFARSCPTSHFFALPSADLNGADVEKLSNLQLLHGNHFGIDCDAGSFDKVICSLALHPLPGDKKLALLREIKRVLRHGGKLYIADFDQPLRPGEIYALRGTGYLFGYDTAKTHTDGTWINFIKQAGFVGIRRVATYSETVGRIAIVRGRRA